MAADRDVDASAHGVSEADAVASGDSDAAAPGLRRACDGSDAAASGDSDVEAFAGRQRPGRAPTRWMSTLRAADRRERPQRAGTLSRFRPAAGPTRARGALVPARYGPTRSRGRESDGVGSGIGVWGHCGLAGFRVGALRVAGSGGYRLGRNSLCIKYSVQSISGERGSESARFGYRVGFPGGPQAGAPRHRVQARPAYFRHRVLRRVQARPYFRDRVLRARPQHFRRAEAPDAAGARRAERDIEA